MKNTTFQSMTGAELRLYTLLTSIADHSQKTRTDNAWLADKLSISAEHVSRLLGRLKRKGWITVISRRAFSFGFYSRERVIKINSREGA